MSIGAVIGWNSPSIAKLMAPDSPIPVTTSNISTLVAMIAIGHIVGPLVSQLVVDRKGRQTAILLSGLSAIICWGLTIVATNIWVRENIVCKVSRTDFALQEIDAFDVTMYSCGL